MRILIINTLYHPYKVGGAEVSVQLMAEALVQRHHQVQVLCLTPEKQRSETVINGVAVCYVPLANDYWPFDGEKRSFCQKIRWHLKDHYNSAMRVTVMEVIRDFAPDLVHTNNIAGFSVSAWSAAKACGVKILHTSRDYYLFHPNATLFSRGRNQDPYAASIRLLSWLKRRYSRLVDGYVGISQFIFERHHRAGFFPGVPQSFIYDIVLPAVEDVESNTVVVADNRKRWRIGFIGKLAQDKGFDEFCLLARHYRHYPEYAFCAAGHINPGNPLVAEARDSGVTLLGFVSLEAFMQQVDIVVLPVKWHEPFGRVVVESVFYGKIVLTNRMGAVSELSTLLPNIYFMEESSLESVINKHVEPIRSEILHAFTPEKIAGEFECAYMKILMPECHQHYLSPAKGEK
ncbi:glycosyltransferase [Dickeya oryzae]|uniref:Glycosyltransferase n=1 Tax=Dickeya oryzae TaxID=1240404 RepID=A0AB39IJM0_9GAMM|nr:glycosyltransferase [Dickeya oryzae]MBP2850995.1 glycosyltransferase [Dickeya oryzae]MBP2858874.1 glycosyltransferase [Dickeya oryzae]MCA6992419.1 glycosyltransferase [Dickeya oryzae]MCA6996712.1 glycosyltransferase [Dickeya oryzae]